MKMARASRGSLSSLPIHSRTCRRISWCWSARSCTSNCGSAATTSCRGLPAPSSSVIRRTTATPWPCRTGSSTNPSLPMPSPRPPWRAPGRWNSFHRQCRSPAPLPRSDKQESAMNKTLLLACVAAIAVPLASASAWMHAGGWGGHGAWGASDARGGHAWGTGTGTWSATGARGGTASGSDGTWSGTGWRGGTASGSGGTWNATGYRGGTATGGHGAWTATGASGHTYYGGPDYYHGGYYGAYNAPTVVNAYGANCYNCGGWNTGGAVAAGLVAGTAIGAAAASTANNQAYAAGVAAGAASASATANPPGTLYGTLPADCSYQAVTAQPYYHCADGLWFVPAYGANGVYYRVVTAP